MTRHSVPVITLAFALLLATDGLVRAGATNTAPDFKEVHDLLRTNLAGATDENLNRAAVEGLLSGFPGRVSLVSGAADGPAIPQGGTTSSKSAILEDDVVYLRAGCVAGNLAGELSAEFHALAATNKVAGVVLDLRFAGGDDAASAQATVDWFASEKAVAGPLIVLVNGETGGAAETLAAALRDAGRGLIIGNPAVNEALTFKEFPLHNGERLRIATPPVNPAGGAGVSLVPPDIAVAVSADDERAFWENPYASPAQNHRDAGVATNNLLPPVDRTSEADLVRAKHNGGDTNKNAAPARAAEPSKPVIRDPVLARAVDLIKGLAVVRKPHF